MDCANNFIGLGRACAPLDPRSGLYLEDIPGLSVSNIASFETGKYMSANAMLEAKVNLSVEQITAQLDNLLPNLFATISMASILDTAFDEEILDAEEGTAGLMIESVKTPLSITTVTYVYVKSASTGQVTINVTDGYETKQILVETVADFEQKVEVNFSSGRGVIRIEYDGIEMIPYSGNISKYTQYACSTCSMRNGSRYVRMKGINPDGTLTSKMYGIRADIEMTCSFERAICQLLPRLKMPIFYLTAANVLDELIASNRINFITTNSKAWAENKALELGTEAQNQLKSISYGLMNYLKQLDSHCTTCKSIRIAYTLPG